MLPQPTTGFFGPMDHELVRRAGLRFVGIDLAPAMVELTRADAAAAGLAQVRVEVADGEDPPLPEATFDAVLADLVIFLLPEHLQRVSIAGWVMRPVESAATTRAARPRSTPTQPPSSAAADPERRPGAGLAFECREPPPGGPAASQLGSRPRRPGHGPGRRRLPHTPADTPAPATISVEPAESTTKRYLAVPVVGHPRLSAPGALATLVMNAGAAPASSSEWLCGRRQRLVSRPCRGANSQAVRKMAVATRTMVPPTGVS